MDNYLNKLGLDLLLEDISKSIINHTSSSIEDNTTEPNNFPTVRAVIDYCKSDIFLQAAVFGGIINEEITPIQESTDENDYMQIIFCKSLNSFYYKVEESGTTKYYANWNNKEKYVDKYDYPYVGKLYFDANNEKYYYYFLTGLKELVMDTITYFENLIDDSDSDIEISYQSASDENIGVVIWSKKFNRFVFSTNEEGDTVYYDNWPTRDHYMDGQSVKLMHFYLNGTDGKLYFTDPEGILTKVTDDFLKAESNQVSKFIPLTDINNAFDVSAIFNGASLLAKDFHWKYYVTAARNVIGILEVTVGQNNSSIEITERFTTSWVLSNNTFTPAGEGHNIYTRHYYNNYRDDSKGIRPNIWTAWYKYSERFTAQEKTTLETLKDELAGKSIEDYISDNIKMVKVSELTYELRNSNGDKIGDAINIPKDQFLKSANYNSTTHKLTLVFDTTAGEKSTEIDLTDLADIYTAGNGINVTNNEISAVLDPNTESYLKLTNKGLKIEGIEDALTSKADKSELDNKADKNSVYTKTETDDKLANKADKTNVYTKTETDTKLTDKADKASTLAGYGIKDAYTKKNVDALLRDKAGTDVYKQIADVDADRRAAPFGKIINEQIDTEEASYGGDVDETLICYSTVLSTFVYKEFGTKKYYANWPTKKHYTDANGYPYFGKQFYCHDENKMYVFDGMKLKAVQIPAVVAFSELWDADIDIIKGSVADEDEFPDFYIVFSTVHNRFVYKADDGKFYDNWSTRYLYVDQMSENNEPRSDVMYFAHDLGNLYIYDYEVSGTLKLINEDLSGFLDKNDHALTEFITAGQEATVVDYANIFGNNLGEISKMHWMYFIHIQQKVVGFMDVQVSYAGNASRIRITERLRTRALLSEDKKSIVWQPTLEWNEDHEYTRFILSYDDRSQEIKAGEWTAWYKYSERFTTSEKTKLTELPTNNELKSTLDKKIEVYDIDFGNDPYNFTDYNWKNADTLPAFITELQVYLNTNYSVFTSQIIEAIEQNRIPRLVNHNTDGNTNYALPVDLNYPTGSTSITFVYECVFNSPTKHTRICKLCIPLNDSKGKIIYEILPSDYAVNEQREIALCHKVNNSETLDVTPYWGKYLVVTYPAADSSMSTIQIAFSSELSDGEMWIRLKGVPTVTVDGTVVTEGIDFVQSKEKILHVTKSGETFEFETLDSVNDGISYNSYGYTVMLYGGSREYITVTDHALELRLVARNIDLEFPNKTMTAMAYLNIITDTPNITIGNPLITTKYQEDFELRKGYYELNCLFNGKEWVVAAMKIVEE